MKSTRGGSRPGAGRPRIHAERATRRGVLLPDSVAAWLRSYGSGSIAAGIIRAVAAIRGIPAAQHPSPPPAPEDPDAATKTP